uniref:Uncharacterized protein n=1 Tax=Arundo donax TaxID=35708 RepID=A0A0A9DSU8_ARUDO
MLALHAWLGFRGGVWRRRRLGFGLVELNCAHSPASHIDLVNGLPRWRLIRTLIYLDQIFIWPTC